ncbi:neprilysin-2-like isoform X2 [Pseudomyrmex gracilis]|uniref:neprilysin-2-like isoform X2 n=1 Tax=Pseudomyrmex gracilis TaxID=219809 RepID=UPI0009953125|nr:neprilysin-2-like isoform X2 [Pseudomyrmex gracilis]
MPSRTYHVNREQGKAAQRDQSYKSCLTALLIFFFLCLVLIIACKPWTKTEKYKDYFEHYHGEETKTTATIPTTLLSTLLLTQRTMTTSVASTKDTTTENFDVVTEDNSKTNVKANPFDRYSENTTTQDTTVARKDVEDYTTEESRRTETTREHTDTATTSRYNYHDIIDNVIDSDTTSMSPPVLSTSASTLKNNVTIIDTIEQVTTSIKNVTDNLQTSTQSDDGDTTASFAISTYSTNTEKSTSTREKSDTTTSDSISSTTYRSDFGVIFGAEKNTTTSTNKDLTYNEFVNNTTDNVISSTTPTSDSNSSTTYRSDFVAEKNATTSTNKNLTYNEFVNNTTNNIIFSTTPTSDSISSTTYRSDFGAEKNATTSTNKDLTYNEFVNNTTDNIISSTMPTSDNISSTTYRSDFGVRFEIEKNATTSTNKNLTYNEFVNNTTDNIISSTTPTQLISAADKNTTTTYKHLDEEFTTTINKTNIRSYNRIIKTHIFNDTSNTRERHTASSEFLNTSTTSDSYNRTITTTILPMESTTETALPEEDLNVCKTGNCKQITSRMLSYMNHSADACDDFYEYACGGFEADPQLMDKDPVERSKNYQRIAMQMSKENRESVYSSFATYYDSCVRYENDVNFNERIRIANDMLREIGKFYINSTWPNDYTDFTNLFAKLILHHSAFLFDVVPEVDEYRPNSLTLKIGPVMFEQYENPFSTGYMDYFKCSENEFDREEQYVNLQVLYENYEKCKKDTGKLVTFIKEALMSLNVFKDVDDKDLDRNSQFEYVNKTVHVIDSVIMKGYFSHFPSKSEIQEVYSTSNYTKMSLDELQSSSTFLNWTQLIRSLTTVDVSGKSIQVYFHNNLTEALQEMRKFAREDSMGLNNALMGLYAHKLYNEMVLPRRNDIKVHCMEAATYLLRLEASSLYISSFTDNEITRMNSITKTMFEQLKKTFKLKTMEAKWAMEGGRERLLRKIDELELALPDASYFKNRDLLYSEYDIQITLYDNYFNNSMILLKRYRTLMYAELGRQVDSKQIWTYFATPFQSKARSIYSLNLIVIPYGIIDWSLTNDEYLLTSLHYLLMANLGISIAHQIAHHFDANGVHYWNQARNIEYSLMYEHGSTDMHFDDYVDCQKKNMYQTSMNMTLPFTDQTISFTIPQLTLNERLSDIVGLRLAYDTLALNRLDAEMRLPWMDLRIDQLFYLAYAQTYCTKTPLTSSFVSLYESENLPSRIRVFVAVSNNKIVADAWDCRKGSQIKPEDICSVFPYIESKIFESPILSA